MRQKTHYQIPIVLMGSNLLKPNRDSIVGHRISAALLRGDKLALEPFTTSDRLYWLTMVSGDKE